MSGVTWSKSVPPVKKPCSWPATASPRPSAASVAPASMPEAMYDSTRVFASAVTSGPISASLSMPLRTISFVARSASSGTMRSATSPTSTATEIAMQRSPAEP